MVRLKDIAARAGVSIMTVSKVLRDAPDIAASTKVRVRALANEMGYVPDTRARSLRNRTTQLFGLVVSTSTDPWVSAMMTAVEEQVAAMGYDLLLAQTHDEPALEQKAIRQMLARRADGLLIVPVYRLGGVALAYQQLLERRIPVVLLSHRAPFCQAFANVESDDSGGAYALTRHLLDLGHRRIAFLAEPQVVPAAQERLEAYRRALREAGIEAEDTLVFRAGSTIEEGGRAAGQILEENCDATAVMAGNDLVAIGAGTVFLKRGLRIPADLSLTGFGDIPLSEHFRVPLTTVRVPSQGLGAAAMELMRQILREGRTASRRLATELVLRESTAPPCERA